MDKETKENVFATLESKIYQLSLFLSQTFRTFVGRTHSPCLLFQLDPVLLQQIIKSYTDTDTDTRTCTLTRSTLTEQTRLRRIHSDVSWDEQWGLLKENIVGGARQGGVVLQIFVMCRF